MVAVDSSSSSSLDSDDDSHCLSRSDLESFSVTSDTTSSLAKVTSSVPALARRRETHQVELPGRYVKESVKSEAPNFDGLFDSVLNGDDWFDTLPRPKTMIRFSTSKTPRTLAVAHLRALRAEKMRLVKGYEVATMPLRDLPEWFDAQVRLLKGS
ncbi:hypothetical protein B9479_000556 [Cryptococcus floricola]|uniref:Uncharacterized protein n=1 Tax=Cryptococcus floricola TaxID=2591691 RepID=A0A5D3B902_9TREE|nr:hypothetical protein B9479_000556 [Cryptococcus floricola]